ncbi:MAG: hypothetical protein HOP13_13625 [Alphaproteobacteria bacterium]|nr:hypothetical protein [Alphaproteobacteria bacterium]
MLKVVMPALVLAILAQAVLGGTADVQVRMGTSEAIATACRLAPGFQSARLWQKTLDDEDMYVREVFADARADVRSAVARFKAELQDRALTEAIDKQRMVFVPGRLTLAGCATVAAVDADGTEGLFPALR